MILYPAIDIRKGHVVRLTQGDYEREVAHDPDPVDAARRWKAQAARALHVVDLDGARSGQPENLDLVRQVADLGVPVQFGGGLRDAPAVDAALRAGADRVVVGTAAVRDPDLVASLVDAHGERVVVSLDSKGGRIAVGGWLEQSKAAPAELLSAMADRGVSRFLHTPIEVDGTLRGPALDGLSELAGAANDAGVRWIYSGGVGSLDDLHRLASLGLDALDGVIVGQALYTGRFTVAEGQAVLEGAG
ncbi:MAG TPA: 1-(5-phosphoribosyl)-5-[(5-phosphoribosylamino)methylideneamino]imidazole-4-carboxamide isomerase [Solirubrobacterales bacterium]